jgi:hypothetical protein
MSLKVPKAGGPDLFKSGYKVSSRATVSTAISIRFLLRMELSSELWMS